MQKIGFIGLGVMGNPMAKNLIQKGYQLAVYDIVQERMEELVKEGARQAQSPKEVAQLSDVIITMLPNSPHVKEVIVGSNGVLEGITAGKVIIDMSSIDPLVTKEVAHIAGEKGVIMLDAPVTGKEQKAVAATLSIAVGGPEETFDEMKDILTTLGSSVIWVGEIGSGNITKIVNEIIGGLNIAAFSEALVLATKFGADPKKIFKSIRGGLAGSNILNSKLPSILERDFEPGFKMDLHIRDLRNALHIAHDIGATLPLTSQIVEIMYMLKARGLGEEDHSAVIKYYESVADVEVK